MNLYVYVAGPNMSTGKEWMKIKFATHSSILTSNTSIRILELRYDIDKN